MIKKLCFFTTELAPNRRAILNYMEKILPKEIEIYLFTLKKEESSPLNRINIIDIPCNKYASFINLRNFCKKNKIDRIINLGVLPQEGLVMLFASIFTKTDFISYQLGNPLDAIKINKGKSKIKTFFECLFFYPLFFFSHKTLLCLKSLTNYYKTKLSFISKNISYLPHLTDTDLFAPKNKKECRRRLKIGINDKVIIFVGRIEYLKGSDILHELIIRNQDKKFILIGELKDEIYKKQKLKNLILINSKSPEELVNYYNASDLCLFPSRLEGIPAVPREAMSCRVPTIMSNIRCSNEIKEVITVPLDQEKINEEIKFFFNLSLKERKKLSLSSRKSIINDFGIEKWKEDLCEMLIN